jgi:hypothetical protein
VEDQPAFAMLSEAKHLANKGNLRSFSCAAQILRFAQDDKDDGPHPTKRSRTRKGRLATFLGLWIVGGGAGVL